MRGVSREQCQVKGIKRGVSGEGYRRRVSDSPGKAYRGIIRGVSRES